MSIEDEVLLPEQKGEGNYYLRRPESRNDVQRFAYMRKLEKACTSCGGEKQMDKRLAEELVPATGSEEFRKLPHDIREPIIRAIEKHPTSKVNSSLAVESRKVPGSWAPVFSMWCICPELKSDEYSAESGGGETGGDWEYRNKDRGPGGSDPVPLNGCACKVYIELDDGTSISLSPNDADMLLKRLTVSKSS